MIRQLIKPTFVTAISFTVAITVLTSGCGHSAPPAPAAHPATVTVAPVEQKEIVEWNEFTGRTEPVDSVEVRPRTSGYIQEVRFQSGQLVKKGDVLFVIDPRWNQATVDQCQAQYDQAKSESDRTDLLLKNNAISAEDAGARKARFQSAKAALDTAHLDLEYTSVRSPIDGRVSRALLTEGNYVSGQAGSASLLTTVVSVNPVYVYASVDEDTWLKFNRLVSNNKLDLDANGRIPVQLELADEKDFPHTGYIESFDNRLDSDTGSILVRAAFQNEGGMIVPGLFARIRIPVSDKHSVVLVDERAIGTDQANKFVLTLTASNTVAYQPVEIGPVMEGKRIIRSGLSSGQKIIVNGMQRVRPGMPVNAEPEAAAEVGGIKTAQR